MESIVAGARRSARQPADVDSAARARLRVDARRRPGASRANRRARSSSLPTIRATWTGRSSWRRCRRAWRYRVAPAMAKEFFKAAFLSGAVRPDGVVHEQPQLLPRRAVLQRVPAAAARSRRAPDAALHRRGSRERLLGADFSRRAADGRRARSTRFRPGIGMIASRLAVPVVPVRIDGLDNVLHHVVADGQARPRSRRVRRADASRRATTTKRSRSRSKRRSDDSRQSR